MINVARILIIIYSLLTSVKMELHYETVMVKFAALCQQSFCFSLVDFMKHVPYFSIDNARHLYKKSKFVKNEHGLYTCERYER
jgi:hypothetical protein